MRTVTHWLDQLGLNRIRNITPGDGIVRSPGKILARHSGHMVHMDVKKMGELRDGGDLLGVRTLSALFAEVDTACEGSAGDPVTR